MPRKKLPQSVDPSVHTKPIVKGELSEKQRVVRSSRNRTVQPRRRTGGAY